MKTMVLKSNLSAGQIERLVLAHGYESRSKSVLDQVAFVRSREAVCYYGNDNGFEFAYRSPRWSGLVFPMVKLNVIKDKKDSYVKMQFEINKLGRLITTIVFLATTLLAFSQTALALLSAKSPGVLFLISLLIPCVFTAPLLLIARQARKETYFFLHDLLSDAKTEEKKLYQTADGILWTGDLTDACTALWKGLMLRAECMDGHLWWWAVTVEHEQDGEIDSSNNYTRPVLSGNEARRLAQDSARNYINKKTVGNIV